MVKIIHKFITILICFNFIFPIGNSQDLTDYSRLSAEGIVAFIDKLLENPIYVDNYIKPVYGKKDITPETHQYITGNLIYNEAVKIDKTAELLKGQAKQALKQKYYALLEISSNRDYPEADFALANLYFAGEGEKQADFNIALNFYQKYLNNNKVQGDLKLISLAKERIAFIENLKKNQTALPKQEDNKVDYSQIPAEGIIAIIDKNVKNQNFIDQKIKPLFPNQEISADLVNYVAGKYIYDEAIKLESVIEINAQNKSNVKKYFILLETASNRQYYLADFRLGNIYFSGENGKQVNFKTALDFYNKALNSKYPINPKIQNLAKSRIEYINSINKTESKFASSPQNNDEQANFKDLPDYSFLNADGVISSIHKLVADDNFIRTRIKPMAGGKEINQSFLNQIAYRLIYEQAVALDGNFDGIAVNKKDFIFAKYIKLLTYSASHDYPEANLKLGNLYFAGEVGQVIDLDRAKSYFTRVLQLKDSADNKIISLANERLKLIDNIRKGISKHPINPAIRN